MPITRDIGVRRKEPDPEGVAIAKSKAASGLVTVTGFDRNEVLFRSDQVGTVQWRDSTGTLVALLIRLKPDIWGFSRRGDDDWEEVLKIYGNPDEE